MKPAVKAKLEELRSDYSKIAGEPFRHFFCPLLLKDEQVRLCQAHLVNQAFPNANPRWTVQRADVDNFYGAFFEADFVALKDLELPIEAFVTNASSTRLRPEISYRGRKIDSYVPNGKVPPTHSEILLQGAFGGTRLALKFDPRVMLDTQGEDWQISVEKDCRLPALVSVLKAAHLALFDMLGYRYAMSAGGMFLGHTVLGQFFLQNRGTAKRELLRNAHAYFAEYANLVRPVLLPENIARDTVTNRMMYICESSTRWAFLVFVRTAELVHAVVVPILESPDAAARFVSFLAEEGSTFQVRRCQFDGDCFQVTPNTEPMTWPRATLN